MKNEYKEHLKKLVMKYKKKLSEKENLYNKLNRKAILNEISDFSIEELNILQNSLFRRIEGNKELIESLEKGMELEKTQKKYPECHACNDIPCSCKAVFLEGSLKRK